MAATTAERVVGILVGQIEGELDAVVAPDLDLGRVLALRRAGVRAGGRRGDRAGVLGDAVALGGPVMDVSARRTAILAGRTPHAPPGVTVGFATAVRLEALPAGFAHASRAIQTAVAFGQEGAYSLGDLSIRPSAAAGTA